MKKIIAGGLALIILVGVVMFNLPTPVDSLIAPARVVAAAVPREGYLLVPTIQGPTGVDTASAFTLTTPGNQDEYPVITIDGQPEPTITRSRGGDFLITPYATLQSNSLYLFRLHRENLPDITWAFQTTIRFEVVSTLPAHQSTNVPVDTGIEITFTSPDHTDIAGYFSIYPNVEGRFINRGATAIFMPLNPLDTEQLYTVTLRAGVALPGTNEVISSDHIFSFETAAARGRDEDGFWFWSSFRFSSRYSEFPSFEPAQLNFMRDGDSRSFTQVNVRVYPLSSRDQATSAVRQLTNAPWWARFAWENSLIDTRGMTPVFTFDFTDRQGEADSWVETMALPETLPPGFYLVTALMDGYTDQSILQITDLAVQIVADDSQSLFWINDMTTGQPAVGATVNHQGSRFTADEQGIAVVTRSIGSDHTITVAAADGKEITLFFMDGLFGRHDHWWGGESITDDYWTVLQLDRTLFQRDDTLYFWGFVQNRSGSADVRNLTVTVTQGWSWWDMGSRDILHRQSVSVSRGAYTGSISLPNLAPGFYNLTIRHGNVLVGSTFFNVQDYVTPPYQFLISSDRRAVFADETVNFTARTEFFEGTPVANLPINYGFWNWGLRDIPEGRGTTGTNGEFSISAVPVPTTEEWAQQGRVSLTFWAEATLPEVGHTFRSAHVDVFVNDIEVQARAHRTGADANLDINVHNITLDRLNDGTADGWNDFLDTPVAGQRLDVQIYRVYWVPIRDGEFYCHIQRRVIPRYRHDRREEIIERFTLTTDANGEASRDFTVPNRDYESYHANVTTTDGNGRTISHRVFIGRDWSDFMWRVGDNSLILDSPHGWDHTYNIGDEVELTVMQGMEKVAGGSFLFVMMQNGILHYEVGTENPFTFTFGEEHVPNVTVNAYFFNGHTYHSGWGMRRWLRFNNQNRELQISVEADRDSYRPGDMSSLRVTVTDQDGNPRPANINISVVDEALLALQDNNVNTLEALYRTIGDGLLLARATHSNFVSDGMDWSYGSRALGMTGANSMDADMASEPEAMAEDSAQAGGPDVRAIFEDTAIFISQATNNAGVADISFQLPDNITSWRVTVSAISQDLYAGNTVENIIVTIPMFLHYALASTFLVGDVPTIGVNAYGTDLTGSETISFEVWDENNPDLVRRATGNAFERVNIPLWEMTDVGPHGLIIQATIEGSAQLADAVRHEYRVVRTHRLVDTSVFYEVTANTVFDVGTVGMTNITFTDRGRGQFLLELMKMRHVPGARLEGLTARHEAERLIAAHFPDVELWHWDNQPFEPSNYQRADGGLAIFPYARSCLETTVRLIPFLREDINEHALRIYLYEIFEGESPENKMLALYGLALLGEPVLLDLHAYALLTDLPVRDIAFIALGFTALGETFIAADMYTQRILPHLQQVEPWYRAYENLGRDSILEATSTIALLASKLDMPQTEGLRQYTARHRTCDLTILIERLTVIINEIENFSPTPASITYTLFGEEVTRDLSSGWGFTLRIPAQNMNQFRLTDVTGEVGAVSIRQAPLEEVQVVDNDITITRSFLREGGRSVTGAFRQDELVRVQITIDYSAKAIHGSYLVTDFLPAGLQFVQGSARFRDPVYGSGWVHARQDGQRVTFFDFNSRFDGVRVYYYYARVITPGTFTAQGSIVQNMGARAYLTVGDDARITVE